MTARDAPAKINLALVVGPRRADGKHEIATVLDRVNLVDRVTVRSAPALTIDGFAEDTLVRTALTALAERAAVAPAWHVTLAKEIPVAAGLGGGSSDAAAALDLANAMLPEPLAAEALSAVAAGVGADVPFFLAAGPQLGTADGTALAPLALPRGYAVVLVLPRGEAKRSTADVYAAFDAREGAAGFEERRAALLEALAGVREPYDLVRLPKNDLASSPLAGELERAGAFRADVSGAGPAVYALYENEAGARAAARSLGGAGRTWVAFPSWYG